jgi:hypothetical protein
VCVSVGKYYFFPSTPPPSLFPFSPTSYPCVSVYCLPLGLSRFIVSPATSSRTTSVGDASARILLCRQQQALEVHQPALGDGGDGAGVQPTSAGGSLGDTSHIPGAVVGARRRTSKYPQDERPSTPTSRAAVDVLQRVVTTA